MGSRGEIRHPAEGGPEAGRVTSEALVRAYIARIRTIDRAGPRLYSVIAINPRALADARRSDAAPHGLRRQVRGPLEGIPALVKDNIETDRWDGDDGRFSGPEGQHHPA